MNQKCLCLCLASRKYRHLAYFAAEAEVAAVETQHLETALMVERQTSLWTAAPVAEYFRTLRTDKRNEGDNERILLTIGILTRLRRLLLRLLRILTK
jgi:hypothetical protein